MSAEQRGGTSQYQQTHRHNQITQKLDTNHSTNSQAQHTKTWLAAGAPAVFAWSTRQTQPPTHMGQCTTYETQQEVACRHTCRCSTVIMPHHHRKNCNLPMCGTLSLFNGTSCGKHHSVPHHQDSSTPGAARPLYMLYNSAGAKLPEKGSDVAYAPSHTHTAPPQHVEACVVQFTPRGHMRHTPNCCVHTRLCMQQPPVKCTDMCGHAALCMRTLSTPPQLLLLLIKPDRQT